MMSEHSGNRGQGSERGPSAIARTSLVARIGAITPIFPGGIVRQVQQRDGVKSERR